jgi:SAM-dependent methyltransferase
MTDDATSPAPAASGTPGDLEGDFDAALSAVADVEGWMTPDQARRLWDRAGATVRGQRIVEIGSFRGRSAIVLARAAPVGVEVVAIDPHLGSDRGPQEIAANAELGDSDFEVFSENLRRGGVADRVRHIRALSADALDDVDGPIQVLYIDGAHRFGPARDDIRDWGARVADGGTLLIHDSFSSIGVTFAILDQLALSGRFRYCGRSTSLAEYRHEPLRGGARAKNFFRHLGQLPWFLRNVMVKVLITVHLTPLTRLLGHRGGDWPY